MLGFNGSGYDLWRLKYLITRRAYGTGANTEG